MTARLRCINTGFDPVGARWSYTLQVTDPAPPEGKQPSYLAISTDTEMEFLHAGGDYTMDIEAATP